MKNTIHIVGLGAGNMDQMSIGSMKQLKKEKLIYLRTKHHPVVKQLEEEGISYISFDDLYEKNDKFEDVYHEIVRSLVALVKEKDITYAVPGHPMIAELTTQLLVAEKEKGEINLKIYSAPSFLDEMFVSLNLDPIDGFVLLDATSFSTGELQFQKHTIFSQVYDGKVASEVKLALLEWLPFDYEVVILSRAGMSDEEKRFVSLHELDHGLDVDNLRSVYVPPVKQDFMPLASFLTLKKIIAQLRGPEGCNWDKLQTHQSLKKYLLEETYEVLEAIDSEDEYSIEEELGDVLLQVMLHAQIANEEGSFSIENIISTLNEKLLRRHPHVFENLSSKSEEEVKKSWDLIKVEEKGEKSYLSKVLKSQPSLMRAYEIQKAAAEIKMDFENMDQLFEKLSEEIEELKDCLIQVKRNEKHVKMEIGDVLFTVVNIARSLGVQPEEALEMTNTKFKNRIEWIFNALKEEGKNYNDMTLSQLDIYWNKSKEIVG